MIVNGGVWLVSLSVCGTRVSRWLRGIGVDVGVGGAGVEVGRGVANTLQARVLNNNKLPRNSIGELSESFFISDYSGWGFLFTEDTINVLYFSLVPSVLEQ